MIDAFLQQDTDWSGVESALSEAKSQNKTALNSFYDQLEKGSVHEVAYLRAAWNNQWDMARDEAPKSYDSFLDSSFIGYRGFWMYLAGAAEYAQGKIDDASSLFYKASLECPSLRWLSKATLYTSNATSASPSEHNFWDDLSTEAIENTTNELERYGFSGRKYDASIDENHTRFQSTKHSDFHQALEFLGKILGFKVNRVTTSGAPDCVWYISPFFYIPIEAKSEHDSNGSIGINDVRQAQSHINWIKGNMNPNSRAIIQPVITSPRVNFEPKAKIYGPELAYCKVEKFQKLFDHTIRVISTLRNDIKSKNEVDKMATVKSCFLKEKLLPRDIHRLITEQMVTKM